MPKTVAYLAIADKTLGVGAQDTLQYTPGPTEKFYIKEWRFIASDTFNIIDVRNSEQFKYTQCSVTHPILSTMVQSPANGNFGMKEFDPPLEIDESQTFSVDVVNTGAAGNVVRMLLIGYKVIAGG